MYKNYKNIIPIVSYPNADKCKSSLLTDNREKSGVYMWVNNLNHESYVGSSINITKRLRRYYSKNYMEDKVRIHNSRIFEALLKHGYSDFSLVILEYCNVDVLIKREQYFIDKLKPEYNICKTAGSMLGFKHSEETKLKFKNRDVVTGHDTFVINKLNSSTKKYKSKREAARNIGVSHTTLLRYINKDKYLNGIYLIKLKPDY